MRPRLRRYAPLAALAVVVVVLAAVFARPPDSRLPYDPRSPRWDGTRALALILSELGAEVDILSERPAADPDTILVIVDNVTDATAAWLTRFVAGGGVLVVTDHGGALSPRLRPAGTAAVGLLSSTLDRACDVPALADVDEVSVGQSALFRVPPGATGCFQRDDLAWLLASSRGQGTLVTLGGPAFLTNASIGDADNAALAAALLAPRPGTRVGIFAPDFRAESQEGRDSLADLIPLPLRLAALQLLIAFVLFALWRGRRLGRPLREPQQVQLPGSELVVAVGNLWQRTAARDRAVSLLRAELRRALAERLGVDDDSDVQRLATAAAARSGLDRDEIAAVLSGAAPATDAELVTFAQRVEDVRRRVTAPVPAMSGDLRADT